MDAVIPSEISIDAFTDVHSLQNSFAPCKKEEEKTIDMLESEFILFGTNHQIKKPTTKINICGENIKSQKL